MATMEDFKRMLDELPSEERATLLASLTKDYEGSEAAFKDRMTRANDARRTPAPGMRDAGRFKVAANPLEVLGQVGQRAVGEYQARGVDRDRAADSGRKQDALMRLMEQLLAKGGASPAVPPAALTTGPQPGAGSPIAAALRAQRSF